MASRPLVPLLKRRVSGFTRLLAALAAAGLLSAGAEAAGKAGDVAIAHGVVTAHTSGGPVHLLGSGSAVNEGDVVTTGTRSVAMLKMADGTRITLRPQSAFQVAKYQVAENAEEGLMTLFKGGLRAVTGFMSKRNPNAMRLRTAVATIGIRGTEFDARLCGADCAAEARLRPVPAGRAGFLKGDVMVQTPGGHAHPLVSGGPIHNGDTVITSPDSFAVLVFLDKSRVTLLPKTEFRVERVEMAIAEPERGTSIFNLLRGGLRAVSGLVGHRGRGYQMRTAVATIGIRGTAWDAVCEGACVNTDPNATQGDGLYTQVTSGAITLDDTFVVEEGQTMFLGNAGNTPQLVPSLPITITEPTPDSVEVPETPPAPSSTDPQDGLYVSCYSGICAVQTEDNTIELGEGQASHVGNQGGPATQLTEVPPFQAEDPVFQAVEAGGNVNKLNESLNAGGLECTVR